MNLVPSGTLNTVYPHLSPPYRRCILNNQHKPSLLQGWLSLRRNFPPFPLRKYNFSRSCNEEISTPRTHHAFTPPPPLLKLRYVTLWPSIFPLSLLLNSVGILFRLYKNYRTFVDLFRTHPGETDRGVGISVYFVLRRKLWGVFQHYGLNRR